VEPELGAGRNAPRGANRALAHRRKLGPHPAAHHLSNPSDEDLVYLIGGESYDVEIADFPRLGRRMIRRGEEVEIYDVSDARSFGPPEGDASQS
jgi:uncharacterized cupin superfamily protein